MILYILIGLLSITAHGYLLCSGMDANLQYVTDAVSGCDDYKSCLETVAALYANFSTVTYVAIEPNIMTDCVLHCDEYRCADGQWKFNAVDNKRHIIRGTEYNTTQFTLGIFYECTLMQMDKRIAQFLVEAVTI